MQGDVDIVKIVENSFSKSDVCRALGFPINGSGLRKVNNLIENLDTSHFGTKNRNSKWKIIEKRCPICSNNFTTHENHPKEKTTCSYACSNTFFRTGSSNGMYNTGDIKSPRMYRRICFENHNIECIICGEDKIVEVHHADENKDNGSPENLVPLCPTHHQYYHSKYRYLVEDKIKEYIKEFKQIN